MTTTYALIKHLPVVVDGYELLPLERPTSSGFTRLTAHIRIHGGGEVGEGEDVWVERDEVASFIDGGERLDLRGSWTFDQLAERLRQPDLFRAPSSPIGPLFRRWGFESAILDLALRQAGLTLSAALELPVHPVRYVLSLRLGEPSTIAPLRERLALDPTLEFKLDPTPDWTPELMAQITAATDGVRVLDFKGFYTSDLVANPPDEALYRNCLETWPEALIEDPHNDPGVHRILGMHWDRVTWDAPLHSLQDITSLARRPRTINVKPCRFGGFSELMAVYDHCRAAGIAMYSGGFFELGPGRGQLQYLASLFHPDGPNDLAPRGHHWDHPGPGIPRSPLAPAPRGSGFSWLDADPPPRKPLA
ncbi:MAG: hypothetical protein R2878_09625 [Thermoleophilia bacterium]